MGPGSSVCGQSLPWCGPRPGCQGPQELQRALLPGLPQAPSLLLQAAGAGLHGLLLFKILFRKEGMQVREGQREREPDRQMMDRGTEEEGFHPRSLGS